MILVTGAAGSVGQALVERLRHDGERRAVVPTDITYPADDPEFGHLDVTDADKVLRWAKTIRPEVIYHLAGAKHAPEGEVDPWHVAQVNLTGTQNVVEAGKAVGARVIFSSTCKACNPETAYGASKLIAERIVLNAGGTVVRFYNVPETSGNVFRLWESLPEDTPIPYTDCSRYFASLESCLDLLVKALDLPPGRYAPYPGKSKHMREVARSLYPDRELVHVPRRRGDRKDEPIAATNELATGVGFFRIRSTHDV